MQNKSYKGAYNENSYIIQALGLTFGGGGGGIFERIFASETWAGGRWAHS